MTPAVLGSWALRTSAGVLLLVISGSFHGCGTPQPAPGPSPSPPTPSPAPGPANSTYRLQISNGCASMPIWISNYAQGYKPISGIEPDAKIEAMQTRRFPMNATGAAYYPKFGCDDSGNKCTSADAGKKPRTLFEFTYPAFNSDADAWDMSFVDGFNLPFKLELFGGCKATNPLDLPPSAVIDCSAVTMADCPKSEMLGNKSYDLSEPASGQKGCMAPCFELQFSGIPATSTQAEQYCCQNEYAGPKCRSGAILRTRWFQRLRAKCRRTYLYPLDDPEGNQGCNQASRQYHLTFYCPEGPGVFLI